MAICDHCGGDMKDGFSCKGDPIMIDGEAFEPIRWGEERRPKRWPLPDHCGDCNTPVGGVHHPGCDLELCPACLGQALGCWHFAEPEEDDGDGGYDSCLEADEESDAVRWLARRCTSHLFLRASRT